MRTIPLLLVMIMTSASGSSAVDGPQAGSGTRVMSTTSANEAPLVASAAVPLYPPVAVAARLSGTVELTLTVKNGRVVEANPKSQAHRILVEAAIANAKTWRFQSKGVITLQTTFIYRMESDEVPVPQNPRVEMRLPSLVTITVNPTVPTCHDCGGVNRGEPDR